MKYTNKLFQNLGRCHNLKVDVTILKLAKKPVKLQMRVQQDAPRKVNRIKEIRRRGKDGLKIGRCHNLKNGKEASEATEGKSSRMRWGR